MSDSKIFVINELNLTFALISSGNFMMGNNSHEHSFSKIEQYHYVEISREFFISTFQTTQKQYFLVTGQKPSYFTGGDSLPVEKVSWHDCNSFIDILNSQYKHYLAKGQFFRLPTEAEWEYACRAGTTTAFSFGDEIDSSIANIDSRKFASKNVDIFRGKTMPVGSYRPNAWGLYDMHGNVWEWCSDWAGEYVLNETTDPKGPKIGSYKILRGGGWYSHPENCRSAYRSYRPPTILGRNIGFRIVVAS